MHLSRVAGPAAWLRLLPVRQAFALLLSSSFAGALLGVRILYSQEVTYCFLGWNLFLAWLPFGFSLLAVWAHRGRRCAIMLPVAGLWLLFFPNAPYLLTDFLHLGSRPPVPIWYDVILLAAFSWAGIHLALASLAIMHAVVVDRAGQLLGWLFALAALVAGSLGVYVGRFLRWNSWDVFSQPGAIAADLIVRLLHPLAHRQIYLVTALLAAFLFICYLTLPFGGARKRA